MAKPVYVPQLGRVIQFSDDASDAQIVAEIKSMIPAGPAAAAAPAGPDESTLLGRAAYGFATGITEIPGGIAALVMPAEQAAASSLGQISEQSRKYLQETFGIDPTKDPTAAQQAAEALGSVGSFLIPATGVAKVASLAGRGARAAGALGEIAAAEKAARLATRAGTATAAAQGVALGAGQRAETIRGQLASGMEISPETQLASQQLSGLIGSLEAAPLERFFGPLTQLLSKVPASKAPVVEKIVKSRLAKITKAGLAEGAQEAASGIANDLMEYGVYNPDVQIGQDLLSSAGTGAFAGSFVEGLIQLAAGRRLRPYRQLQKDLAAETQQNAIDARRGIISTAAEQLRQYNVDGPVEVIQDEVENVPIFSLKTRAGNIIGEFADRNAVTEALDIYKAKTGAKVDIIEPEKVVEVFPVKINQKQYGSLDEVKADRDSLISKIGTMKTTIADPRFLEIGSKQNNVSPEFFKKKAQLEVDKLVKQVEPLEAFVFEAERPKPPEGIGTLGTRQAEFAVGPVATAPKLTPAPTLETPPEAITDVPEAVSVEPVSPIGMAEEAAVEAPEAVIEAPEAPPTVGSVPFMMTNKIRSDLRGRGYTEEQIFNMRPEEAQDILSRPPEAPPEQLSAGPLPEVAPTPKTVREVTAEVTAPRDYTPEQRAFDERVFTGLKSRLSTLNLPGIEPVLREMIDKKPGYLVRGFVDAKGTPNDMKIILELSKGILDPRLTVEQNIEALTEVMNHEIIHIVRRMGLFRPAEWNILSKAVKNTKVPGKSYTYLDKAEAVYAPMGGDYADPDAVVEEAVAEMYKDWVSGKSKPVQNTTGLLNRLREFFRRIFGVLKSSAQEQVFKRIEAGDVGGREAIPIRAGERFSAGPLSAGSPLSRNLDDRSNRAFDLYPYLRTSAARYYDHAPKITATTNPQNAARQIANLDQLLRDHPNVLASDAAWADYVADAMGKAATTSTGVPIAPYKAVDFANNPRLIADQLGRMTSGQLNMAESGLSAAKDFEQAYRSGTATPIHTAKLILWGILSRGVSPFVQESMFLDVVKPVGISNRTGKPSGGIDQFIQDAIDGQFDLDAYRDYVKTLKIDGLPGAGTTHNLGAFGETTLVKLQQRVPDGRTLLQYLHDMIQDYSLSGKEIRRRFHQVNPGIGINNKVLSFILLVTGRDDVMVLDRVQMRNQFNDGMFDDYNLYDGVKIPKQVRSKDGTVKTKNVTDAGSGIAHLGDGVRGLMYYEALERDLTPAVRQAYSMLNRGNQFSMGRYHWESWVATSAQEVDHGSISGLLKDATGEVDPYRDVHTGEGKYNTYNSGMVYGYTDYGEAYVGLPDGLGRHYYFTPDYAKKVVDGYEKRSTGIIKSPIFKVSESVEGPWYERPEVDKQKLRDYLWAKSEEFKAERGRAFRKRVQEASKANAVGSGPGPVNAIRRLGGVRQPLVTDAKSIADKYIGRDGTERFSAAPLPDTEEFKIWFRRSAVVNRDGSPRVMYHGTSTQTRFDAFAPGLVEFGTHFGTARQANSFVMDRRNKDVPKEYGRIFPVYLSIQNPIRLRDTGTWDNNTISSQLYNKGLISGELLDEAQYQSYDDASVRAKLVKALTDAGHDGIVYLNRVEGLNKGSLNGIFEADLDWQDISDQQFRGYAPEAEDSYIILDGRQAKSVFNEFKPGESRRLSFSAAPLPADLEAMNEKLYAPAPQKSFKDMIFDFFLSETPTDKKLKTDYGDIEIGKWTRAGLIGRAAAVDKYAIIEHIEKLEQQKKTGNFERNVADYSALASLIMSDRSSQIAASMMMRGTMKIKKAKADDILSATIDVEESPDSLMKVFEIMLQPGAIDSATGKPKDKRDIFRLYATAKRAIGLKAEGKRVPKELTDANIKKTISFTETNYPEIVEAYKMYQRFNRSLLQAAVDAELISAQAFADLTKRMDYYSYYYEVFEEPYTPNIPTKTASRFNLRPYKGTELGGLVNDPMYVMLQNMQFWTSAIAKNLASRKSFELGRRMGVTRLLGTGEDPDRTKGEEDQVMFFRDKGVDRRFAVSDPLLVSALGSDDRIDVGRFWQIMGLPTQLLRESITRDPGFMVANLMRDTVSAWITSGADILPFIGTIKGFANAYKNGASFQALQGRGVVGSYDLAMLGPQELASRIRYAKMPKNIHMITSQEALMGAVGTVWNRLGSLSEMSDAATRIAVYDSAIAQGFSEAEASFRALEIMNFSRRGASQTLSILTKLVPFLNARIQGLDVLYQAGRAGIRVATGRALGERDANLGKKFLIRGGMLAAISIALEMLNDDDEDYQQIDDYVKNANLLIPLSGFGLKGEFIAIPKAFEPGLLFSTFPQQFYKSMTGQAGTRENVSLFASSFASTFGVNPIPQFMLPALEVIVNHDFYTGLPLISEGQARLAPELQYNSRTSQLAMMISGVPVFYNFTTGKFEGASPIVVDNLISGYGGPLGTYIVQAASLLMEGVDVGPDRLPRSVSQLPVVRRFFIDTESRNPKVVSQAYELFRVVDEANRSFSRLKQIGDAEAVKDYLDENRDVLSYRKYVFRLVEGLNKLAARERQIAADQEMTREEKFEAMRKLRETRLNLASKVSEINEKIGR